MLRRPNKKAGHPTCPAFPHRLERQAGGLFFLFVHLGRRDAAADVLVFWSLLKAGFALMRICQWVS